MSDTIDVSVRLPDASLHVLNLLVADGRLGETVDEVVSHILRQYLFERVAPPASTEEAKP